MFKRIAVLVLGLVMASGVAAQAYPTPAGHVNDFAGVLSVEIKSTLEAVLIDFETETQHEIAVATIPDLHGLSSQQYAHELFNNWGIGKDFADNGILMLVAPAEREMWIEVGYGLEGVVPDILAKSIVEEYMVPRFKEGNFDQGVYEGVTAVLAATRGEPLPHVSNEAYPSWWPTVALLFLLIHGGVFLATTVNHPKRSWPAALLGIPYGLFAGILFSLWFGGLRAVIIGVILLAALFYLVSKVLGRRGFVVKRHGGGGSSWWGGGSSSGGGGGGGFGGGSSGGGGGGGSW